jgi:hypothetical protein
MAGIDEFTKLMLHLNGADESTTFTDDSDSDHTVSGFGTAQIDTAQSKFGGASLFLDGNSDYLSIPDSSDWDIFATTTEEWTIDTWVRRASSDATHKIIQQTDATQDNTWLIQFSSGNPIVFTLRAGGSTVISLVGPVLSTNTWHHIALVKKADEYGFYVNGTQVAYIQNTSTINLTEPLYIGRNPANEVHYFDGYIDELRIQKSNYFNASPNSEESDTITVPTEEYSVTVTPPGTPQNLTATTASSSQIDLSWDVGSVDSGDTITGYKIERESPEGNGFSTLVADTESTDTTYSDTGLDPDTEYNYRVSAIADVGGESDPSNEAKDTTDAGISLTPQNLTATADGLSQIDLSWDAPENNGGSAITGYKIERESPEGNGFSTLVADTESTDTTYSDTGLDPDTEYNYRVSAINSFGTSDPSNEAKDTTDDLIDNDTILLLHFDGLNGATETIDSSPFSNTVTMRSSSELSSSEKKFSDTSLKTTNDANNGLVIPENALFPGGNGDWTVEFFIYFNDRFSNLDADLYRQIDEPNNIVIIYEHSGEGNLEHFELAEKDSGANTVLSDSGDLSGLLSNNTWHHVAIVRNGTNRLFFLDGVLTNTESGLPSVIRDPVGDLEILGENDDNTFDGFLDEYRISDVARYTENFTPPQKPFGALDEPTSLVATAVSLSQIDLSWDAPANNGNSILGYRIERESPEGDGFSTLVADTGNTNTTYSDTDLDSDTEYNYRVSAINEHGWGLFSTEANATTSEDTPGSDEKININKFTGKHENIDPTKNWVFDKFTGKHYKNYNKE